MGKEITTSSNDTPIKIEVFSKNNSSKINVEKDLTLYYSTLAKKWAISDSLVDNEDYSAKYYAKNIKQNVENIISDAKNEIDVEIFLAKEQVSLAEEQVELAKQQVSLAEIKGSEQVNLAKEQVDLAKEQVLLAETKGAEQVNLAKVQVDLAKEQVLLAEAKGAEQVNLAKAQVNLAVEAVEEVQELADSINGNFANVNLSNIDEAGENVIKNLAKEVSNGLPIGSIIPIFCSNTYVPEGLLPCDGVEYAKTQFSSFWTDWLVGGRLNTCTYEEYASDISTYGECLKFGLDIVNNKFKVPTKKDVSINDISITGSAPVKTNQIAFGNNAGALAVPANNSATTYYVSSQDGSGNVFVKNNTGSSVRWYADLEGKVVLKEIQLRYFVVVATGSINQSEMDWSEWASSLQGKLNLDHSNDTKPYIVETYANETSWYRIWSDNWCEQGGIIQVANIFTIELLKAYKDMNYIGFVTGRYSSAANYSYNCHFYPITNNSATIYIGSSSQNICQWKCVGYV